MSNANLNHVSIFKLNFCLNKRILQTNTRSLTSVLLKKSPPPYRGTSVISIGQIQEGIIYACELLDFRRQ